MTTYVSPTPFTFQTNSTGTLFTQGWYQGLKDLRDALVACGMVQTADTGQQDFTLAGGSSAVPAQQPPYTAGAGFIVRMNDSLANSGKPVYMKIASYSNTNPAYSYGWAVTVGSGSDGAGNITGAVGSLTLPAYIPNTDASYLSYGNQRSTYASGNGSEIAVAWHDAANAFSESWLILIERTRNDAGSYDGEGVLFTFVSSTSSSYTPLIHTLAFPTNGNTTPLGYGWQRGQCFPRYLSDRSTYNTGNDIGPMIPYSSGFFPKFRQTHVAYLLPSADMPTIGQTFTMPVLGTNRTFRIMGYQYSSYQIYLTNYGVLASGGTRMTETYLAMMWE